MYYIVRISLAIRLPIYILIGKLKRNLNSDLYSISYLTITAVIVSVSLYSLFCNLSICVFNLLVIFSNKIAFILEKRSKLHESKCIATWRKAKQEKKCPKDREKPLKRTIIACTIIVNRQLFCHAEKIQTCSLKLAFSDMNSSKCSFIFLFSSSRFFKASSSSATRNLLPFSSSSIWF